MSLPHLDADRPFLAEGGLETTLIFHRGVDLPLFASFVLLKDDAGRRELRDYYDPYLAVARAHGVGMLIDTATWRASPDWGHELGYAPEQLDAANREAAALARGIVAAHPDTPVVVNGVVGPRGDGYDPAFLMSPAEAEGYHARQVATLADGGVDLISALTMTHAEEAIGIVRAAQAAGVPVAVSFTVETDGRLPTEQPLGDAIAQVDAATDGAAAYFMVNCAHPTHFAHLFAQEEPWHARIRGLRANASAKSHAELDEAESLDEGDPADLGDRHRALRPTLPRLAVLGGCCGTDHRHVAAIAEAWAR